MNATWCEAYTTLVIDHTHTYTEYVGKIASTGATEYKCGVCGHRTDEILGIASNDRYTEVVTELWQDNYKEYKVTFDSDGYRMLQTFGEGSEATHAYIELYGPNGLLAYDNIRGYARNPMLTYNFVADLTYTVRVSFFNSQWSFTNIKLSIIETDAYFEYEDIPSFVDRTEDYVNDFVLDKVTVFTYESTTDRDITIRLTTPHFIGYLYVIDPRSEEVLTLAVGESTKEEASLYHEADEADAGFVAEITKTLEANVPYLVILSTECPSSTMMTGEFCVTFD